MPMSPRILVQLGLVCTAVCVDLFKAKLFKAATLCAFEGGAFHNSELVRASKFDNSHSMLQMENLLVSEDGVLLHIRQSKTD